MGFIQVKHSTNEGGAVASRDNAGVKEKYNIAILQKKWPGVFSVNGRRKAIAGSEVVMSWKRYGNTQGKPVSPARAKKPSAKSKKKESASAFPIDTKLRYTKKLSASDYINKRCIKCHLKKVRDCIGMRVKDGNGQERSYGVADLKYDIGGGRLELS